MTDARVAVLAMHTNTFSLAIQVSAQGRIQAVSALPGNAPSRTKGVEPGTS